MSLNEQIGVSEFAGAAILEVRGLGAALGQLAGCSGFFCIRPFTLMYFGTEPGRGDSAGPASGTGWPDGPPAGELAVGPAAEAATYAGFLCIKPSTLMYLGTGAPASEALG